MCQVLGVSRSGYYARRGRFTSSREKQNIELLKEIRKVYQASKLR